jgi:hypothetical protein
MERNILSNENDNTPIQSVMPDNCPKYTDMSVLTKDYETLSREAASIVLLNYSTLNMAIENGFSESNKKFKATGVNADDFKAL